MVAMRTDLPLGVAWKHPQVVPDTRSVRGARLARDSICYTSILNQVFRKEKKEKKEKEKQSLLLMLCCTSS